MENENEMLYLEQRMHYTECDLCALVLISRKGIVFIDSLKSVPLLNVIYIHSHGTSNTKQVVSKRAI